MSVSPHKCYHILFQLLLVHWRSVRHLRLETLEPSADWTRFPSSLMSVA